MPHSPAANSTTMIGVASPIWPPISSKRCCPICRGAQLSVRPPCLAKLAHPCPAFHTTTGANNVTASAAPIQRYGERTTDHRRSPMIQITGAAASSTPVYLLPSPNPMATPVTTHQRGSPLTRASAHSVITAKNKSGVSGVIVTAPAPSMSVAFSSTAAATPGRRSGNSRFAASASINEPNPAAIGPSSRTPSVASPSTAVPSQIHSATIGGWSR